MQTGRFLITGGSQGIGAALVESARAAGHHVVFTGRNQALIEAVAKKTGAFGLRADVAVGDDNARTVDLSRTTRGKTSSDYHWQLEVEMAHRSILLLPGALTFSIALAMPFAVTAERPVAKAAVGNNPAPRTLWGAPDLTGIWTGSTITPLERPSEFAGKEFLTEQEAADLEKRALEARADRPPPPGDPGTYNQVWFDPASKVVPSRRTSLIVDPRDGRIPFTAQGRAEQLRSRARYGKGPFDSSLDLDTGERCLTDGLPLYFAGYNNNYQFFQSPSSVVILHELYHEARVVYLDGRPHANIRRWLGDSRGHWEDHTLVVDTINFLPRDSAEWQDAWRASRSTTHLVERFTRVNAETMEYQFTWEDPTMFVRPWTAAWSLTTNQASRGVTEGGIFEYACHEGNYAMTTVLEGARAEEAEPARSPTKR